MNSSKKDLYYERKLPDNKGIYYYPLKRNFASIEEEKNYIHYYGEDVIDRVSRLNESVYKKDNYIQDDVITNFIFIYLLNKFKDSPDLIKTMKSTLKKKVLTKNDIIKRAKLLYDRYHGITKDNFFDFSFLSCKKSESANILTLFQNNKQLYCNIDNIYDCSFHTAIEPNFDNPASYDQFKYLRSFKNLLEYSIYILENSDLNKINCLEDKEITNEEFIYHIDNNNDSVSNTSTKNISNSNSNVNSNSNTNSNGVTNEENININLNNNNTNTNINTNLNNNNNNTNNNIPDNEIVIENSHGISKTLNFSNFSSNDNNDNNNINLENQNLKAYIIKLIQDYNSIIKDIECQEEYASQIKKVRYLSNHISNASSACSDLCYKNLLLCETDLIDKAFKETLNRKFPVIYEVLFIKFLQMVKYNPCSICKILKHTLNKEENFNFECYEIYFHMINFKYNISKIINKELLNINLKENENLKKSLQSRKSEEKNIKNKYLPYTPCAHFGNEVCDENCPCSEREYCERFCKCNKLLCKYSHTHLGCHCFKGECVTNHCPCYINAKECDPVLCKNCNKINSKCKNRQLYLNCQAKIIVGISKIAGWGLFANEPIKKDALIGEYKGELINEDITNKRDRFKVYENSTYMFTLDDEYTIDSRKIGNMLRYANHSKKNANSYPRVVFCGGHHRIGLFAKRHINKGEEIKFDYDGQNILSKQFPWINDEKEEKEKLEGNVIKKRKGKKRLASIKFSRKKNKEENEDEDYNDISNEEKEKEVSNKSSKKSVYSKDKNEEDEKMEIEYNYRHNNSKSTRNSVRKSSKFHRNKMIQLMKDEENNNDIDMNSKNSISLFEDKKEQEDKPIIKSNINNMSNLNINNKKYIPLSAKMIAQTLLRHKRYFEKKSEEFLSKEYEENNSNNSLKNVKISVNNSFTEKNKHKKISEQDFYKNNLFFKDKQIKLISQRNDSHNNKNNRNINNKNGNNMTINSPKIKIYDLGTIRVMINFQTPIVADFTFYGPQDIDFFKKYDILIFESKDFLNEIKIDFDKDIYGYLIHGKFNRGHMILVNYLKFFENRVYYYRNESQRISIYIFGRGENKNSILEKFGIDVRVDKLTFVIKSE